MRVAGLMSLDDLAIGARLLRDLPGFFRRPLRADEARSIVRRRLQQRAPDLLALARQLIYNRPASPYRKLLAIAE